MFIIPVLSPIGLWTFQGLDTGEKKARLMGADPTASPVTGECSTVELQPQTITVTN